MKLRNVWAVLAISLATPVFAVEAPVDAVAPPLTLKFCTGGEGGFYESLGSTIGQTITQKIKAKSEIINTGGSVDNAEMMKDGDCDIAIIQADAVTSLPLPTDVKVSNAHVEAVYWLHGKNGVSDFGEMESGSNPTRFAVATVTGSGGEVTLKNFIKTDKDYEDIRTVEFEDWYSAAEASAQGYTMKAGVRIEIAGMLYVGRPGFITADIVEDFSQQLTIGEINDDSFGSAKDVNNNPLYFICDINSKQTSGLKTDTFSSPDTYCLRAQIVYNNEFHKNLPAKQSREVRRAVDKGINSVLKAVR